MTKSIMIFGAGINQLELIREGKKLGLVTVAIDPSNDPPGKKEADYFYQINGDDYKFTKAIAIKHNVKGIITGQMEKPLRLMSKLAKEMGYIFNKTEVIEATLDKDFMKKIFIDNDIPCAKYVTFDRNQHITKQKIDRLSFPLILKPADTFSSRAVKKIKNFQ